MTTEPPHPISSFLAAHRVRDVDAAMRHLTTDATVTDEGRTYRGSTEIRAWLQRGGSEYTYTIELTGIEKIDDDHYVATHHLEGDFPGNVVDLRFRLALRDGLIANLVIAP